MDVQCQCGAVSFKTPTPAPIAVWHCHCHQCRAQTGSAFGTSAIFPSQGILPLSEANQAAAQRWIRPAEQSDSGREGECYFCKTCGVRILHRIIEKDGTPRDSVAIKGGLIKDLDWKSAKHLFTKEAVVPIPEGVEAYETIPAYMRPG